MSSSDSMSSEDEESVATENEEGEDQGNIEQQADVPQDISLDCLIVGICCHPKKNFVAAGTIDGPIHLYSFEKEKGNQEIVQYDHHKKPCRAVHFSAAGEYLFSGSQDTTIQVIDLESNSVYRKFCRTDGSSVYSLLPIDDFLLASGEDDGQVVIWDFRMQAPIACFEECEEYISSLSMSKEKKMLLATSGEGTLSVYNVRARKMEMRSELFDFDFLSSTLIKGEKKIVIGAGDGSLNIFNVGEYGNISDRFPGHPGSVDCIATVAEDVVCTGCEDGKIRAVQLFPNRFLGVLGSHNGFSVDGLSTSSDCSLLVSSSYDQKIKFWDLSGVEDVKSEDVKDTKVKHRQLNRQVDNFFADLE